MQTSSSLYTRSGEVFVDLRGNLIDDGQQQYTYNLQNQLVAVAEENAIKVKYAYDPVGRRVFQSPVAGSEMSYVYSGNSILEEWSRGELVRKFILGPRIDEPVAMVEGEQKFFHHFDALGSVVNLTDINGKIANTYRYDVYGCFESSATGWKDTPYKFTGRRFDSETGLYNYRARIYNPVIGRFMQNDPLGYVDGLNMFAYVKNNPVTGTDPFGLLNWCYWKCSLWCNAVGTIVICPPFSAGGFAAGGPAGLIIVGGGCFIVTKTVCHKICSDRCPPPETPPFCGPPEPTPPGPGAPNPGGPRYN